MQVIYRWAFAVASASPLAPTLKSGGARASPEYMAPAPLVSCLHGHCFMYTFVWSCVQITYINESNVFMCCEFAFKTLMTFSLFHSLSLPLALSSNLKSLTATLCIRQ